MSRPPTRRVPVRGVELAVETSGTGRDLLWGHGVTGSRAQEDEIGLFPWDLTPLARVVRWDARGHGESTGSPDPRRYTWQELARDELALADELGIERFVAGGASLGSATALHAAVMEPERIAALVLVLPPAAWELRAGQADLYEKMASIVEDRGVDGFADLVAGRPPYPFLAEAMPEVTDIVNRHVRRWDGELAPHIFRGAALSDLPPREAVARVETPALVLTWSGDPGHPDQSASALHEVLPDSRLAVARDLSEVREWPARVRSFLETLQ